MERFSIRTMYNITLISISEIYHTRVSESASHTLIFLFGQAHEAYQLAVLSSVDLCRVKNAGAQ